MADPILKPTTQPPVTEQSTNGEPAPFGAEMEKMLTQAFAEARPDKFKAPTISAPVREARSPSTEEQESTAPTDQRAKPAEEKLNKPTGAPEVKTTQKAAQWKEVNDERDRLRKENETFKTEREKWSKDQIDRTEHETLKKQNSDLLARMEAVALEKSPRFENHFKGKTDNAIALAKQAVGDSHAERVSKLLQLPDSDWRTNQLEEVMVELSPTRQARLGAAIVEMDRIELEKSTALSKSRENWEAMQQADRAEKQNQSKLMERTFQDTIEKWSDPDKGLALFQKKDGDDAHNAEVSQRVETARNILNMNLSAEQLSKAALWSAAAPGLLRNMMALSEELKTVKAENESLKSGGPELETGGETKPVDDDAQYAGMSAGEIIAQKALKAGGWS